MHAKGRPYRLIHHNNIYFRKILNLNANTINTYKPYNAEETPLTFILYIKSRGLTVVSFENRRLISGLTDLVSSKDCSDSHAQRWAKRQPYLLVYRCLYLLVHRCLYLLVHRCLYLLVYRCLYLLVHRCLYLLVYRCLYLCLLNAWCVAEFSEEVFKRFKSRHFSIIYAYMYFYSRMKG